MQNSYSTFPLDERAILRSAVGRALCAPVTWMPLVPIVAAPQLWELSLPAVAGLGGTVLGGLVLFWRHQWCGLTKLVRREMIRERLTAQTATLCKAAGRLRLRGARAEADLLEQFVNVKSEIEQRLCVGDTWTEQKCRIEDLVEGLCFGARDALCRLIERKRAGAAVAREEVMAQVAAALSSLWQTASELDAMLAPFEGAAGLPGPSLGDLTQRLRLESEVAAEVRALLAAPIGAPDASSR